MMTTIMLFLHVVGAVGMGIYAILPFLAGQFKKLSGSAQEGLASGIVTAGRFGQFALVLQLLTGGYLMSKGEYATSWMIVITVLFLAIGALSGIVQGPAKRIASASRDGQDASAAIAKVQTLSGIILILFLIVLWVMQAPW